MTNSRPLFEAIWKPSPGKSRGDERRRHPRKASLIPVAYVTEGRARRDFILNISSGGVFIGRPDEACWGREVLMSFVHPGTRRNLSIVGRIAWVSSMGVGVRFKRLAKNGEGSLMTSDMKGSQSYETIREVGAMGKIRKKRIRWEPSMSGDVEKYRLYWSEDGMVGYGSKYVDVGKTTEVVIPDDVPSLPMVKANLVFGVTALTEAGNESDMAKMTAEVDFVVPDAPSNLIIEEV